MKNPTGIRNGLQQSIRDCLKSGSMTHATLCELLPQFTARQISQALEHLYCNAGGVTRSGTKNNRIYSLFRAEAKTDAPVLNFRPLCRDPFENWRRCERAPFDPSRDLVALIR